MRILVRYKLGSRDLVLAQSEFAYNILVNRSTRKTYFEIVTCMSPKGVPKLRDLKKEDKRGVEEEEFVIYIKSLH